MFKKYPPVLHILIVGKQGSYKDITAVRMCYKGLVDEKKKIFANQNLSFDHTRINTFEDLITLKGDNWNPSMLYFHDLGRVFNSRDYKKSDSRYGNERRDLVNNLRKTGVQLIGTCHREMEVDIDIRMIIDFFVYPKYRNINDKNNMEDDVVVCKWYDVPDHKDTDSKPVMTTYFTKPHRYAEMYNTLEKVKSLL